MRVLAWNMENARGAEVAHKRNWSYLAAPALAGAVSIGSAGSPRALECWPDVAEVTKMQRLARRLPPRLRRPLIRAYLFGRRMGVRRLHWRTKLAVVHSYGVRVRDRPVDVARFVLTDPETFNFTYEISNVEELVSFVARALSVEPAVVVRYVTEIRDDEAFEAVLRQQLRTRGLDRKRKPLYGRRLGWYAIARILQPSLIVETGIHDGLGSALLLRALRRNSAEGSPGQLVSIDIDPGAGWLVDESLRERWTPVYGSTFDELERAIDGREVGMIIHDSEHTYECETFEFGVALRHAAERLVMVSDNAHATTALSDVCQSIGVGYSFFRERPRRHFYPGDGIGIGVVDRSAVGSSLHRVPTRRG